MSTSFPASSVRARGRRMLAALAAATLAITASVLGAALPASAAGTASISGTVTASDGGAPLADIFVEAFSFNEFGSASSVFSTQTAPDGTFTASGLDAGSYSLTFYDDTNTYVSSWLGGAIFAAQSQRITLADGENASGADIALDEAGVVTGTVTASAGGAPLESVQVTAYRETAFGTEERTVSTNSFGQYIIGGLREGNWTLYFDAAFLGYVSEYHDNTRDEFEATPVVVLGGSTSPVDASLDLGGTVTGSVARLSNPAIPIEGVQIQVIDDASGATLTGFSLADGTFEVIGVAPGNYRVQASAIGNFLGVWWDGANSVTSATLVPVASGQVVDGIDLLMQDAGTITGTVTGPLGEPLASVGVSAQSEDGMEGLFALTDENGQYVLNGIASKNYLINFAPEFGLNVRAQYWPGSDLRSGATFVTGVAADTVSGIDIQLPEGSILGGRVTDQVTTDPLEGIEVFLESRAMNLVRYAYTDTNGDWEVVGLPAADDYEIEFRDPTSTYADEWFNGEFRRSNADPVTLDPQSTVADVNATLILGATVSGRVVDEGGVGIAETEVWFAPGGTFRDGLRSATTAADGSFAVRGLAPGAYWVLTGDVFAAEQVYRTEWYDNVYDPQLSDSIVVTAGQEVLDFTVDLANIEAPEYPGALTIGVEEKPSGYPTVEFGLPQTSGVFAFGLFAGLNLGNDGVGYTSSFFDSPQWVLADELSGINGHGLITAQAFNSDGFGPAVRELVMVGDGPAIPYAPELQLDSADGTSFTLTWNLDADSAGVDFWQWNVFSVDEPGEPYLQSGSANASDPRSETQTIGGLEPSTEYEIFVIGFTDQEETTLWSGGRFSTTDGPEVLGFTQSPTPTVTGGPRLGGVLTATPGAWAPAPVSLAYQWLRDGATIVGATSATYAPTVDDLGAELSVRVTGSKNGYLTQSRTSDPTAPVVNLNDATNDRLAGANRYATAVEISQARYGTDVPVVYLATGTGFPDALSAASAAAHLGGPLLVTLPTSIPTVIQDELLRLNPARVVIVGGTGVVSPAVEAAVEALLPSADVDRHFGADRYATSREIAINAFTPGETSTAFIATGRNFPDALAASAAAGAVGAPVILVNGTSTVLDTPTRNLLSTLQVERVFIAGGTGVVSAQIESALRTVLGTANVTRLAGADRYLTAVAINDAIFETASRVYFATGRDFPDALAGAALAGAQAAPLYTVPGTCVPRAVLDSMARLGADEFVLLGGTGVLSNSVRSLTTC